MHVALQTKVLVGSPSAEELIRTVDLARRHCPQAKLDFSLELTPEMRDLLENHSGEEKRRGISLVLDYLKTIR